MKHFPVSVLWWAGLMILCAGCPSHAIIPVPVPDFKLRFRIDKFESANAPPEAAKRNWFLNGSKGRTPLKEGDWSDWVEFAGADKTNLLKRTPNMSLHSWPVVAGFSVNPYSVQRMQLSVEWQVGETEGSYSATYVTPSVAALLWLDAEKKYHVSPSSEYNQRYLSQVEKLKLTSEDLPKQLIFVDRYIGVDGEEKAWSEGFDLLRRLGFNTIMAEGFPQAKRLLSQLGVSRTAGGVYWPPLILDVDPKRTSRAAMDEWAEKLANGFRKAGWDPKEVAFFALADEPGWYFPSAYTGTTAASKQYVQYMTGLFRAYLKAKGLRPSDFGAKTWDEVEFLGRSDAKDLPTKRRFYWSTRFFADNSADVFARWTQAMERAFYPGIPLSCNWNFFSGRYYVPGPVANNPDKQSPDAAMGGHDWIDFGRRRGVTTLWTEDWFGDGMSSQWSFYLSKLRSAANHYNLSRKETDPVPIGFGGYVVGATVGGKPGGALQKVLSIVGHGGKTVYFYVFGPEYAFPGNCWSENFGRFAEIASALRVVGKAEDLLYPGKPVPTEVAILTPQSAQVWDKKDEQIAKGISDATNNHLNSATVDYVAEVFNLYCALQHANIPVDWVDEQDLADGVFLKRIKVLYVTTPNLSLKAADGLRRWVADGGVLVAVAGSGQADEYDEPSHELDKLLGVKSLTRERLYSPSHGAAKGSIKPLLAGQGAFMAYGFEQPLNPTSAKAVAQFAENGQPAITQNQSGKGSAIVFGTLVGTAYNLGGQTDEARRWITWPVQLAGVRLPVEIGAVKIESPVLESDGGLAVVLLNWSGKPVKNISVRIAAARPIKRVVSVQLGEQKFELADGKISIVLPGLDAADVLKLYW